MLAEDYGLETYKVLPGHVVLGLIGSGISRSITPSMHRHEAASQHLQLSYKLIDTDNLPRGDASLGELIRAAELCGFAGLNITFPYKVEVISHLDELSDNAKTVGAVNTVLFQNGKRIGHNTDMWGFAQSFKVNMPDADIETVMLVGAGGAGSAVAHALVSLGVNKLLIVDYDDHKSQALAESLNAKSVDTHVTSASIRDIRAEDLSGIVNATPVGMKKLPGSAVPIRLLKPKIWVADIVYFPLKTELLATAEAIGCRTLPGSGMAVFQAVRAFELFTGLKADAKRMLASFDTLSKEISPN